MVYKTTEAQRQASQRYYQKHREELKQQGREYYWQNREELIQRKRKFRVENRDKIRAQDKAFRLRQKMKVLTYYSNGQLRCVRCGIDDLDVLCIDHIEGGGTKHTAIVGTGGKFYSWLISQGFPSGYQVLCHNCNWKKRIMEGM